ncbi:hypothetical protein EV363DRAFT_1196604, partial [Boletus edulis]
QVKEARDKGLTVPVSLIGYCKPVLTYGEDKVVQVQDARDSGANKHFLLDLPPDEAFTFREKCKSCVYTGDSVVNNDRCVMVKWGCAVADCRTRAVSVHQI